MEAALPLMGKAVSGAAYEQHLRALWPLVRDTETALTPWHSGLQALWGHGRALVPRHPLIQQDLTALTGAPWPAPIDGRAAFLQIGQSLPHAVGCWYVLGGSRLGGQVICRHLRRTLPAAARVGLAYYGASCPADGTLFRTFLRTVDARSDLQARMDDVVEGAVKTFEHWYRALSSA